MFGGGKGSTGLNQVSKIKKNKQRTRAALGLALGVVVAELSPVAQAGSTWTGTTNQDWSTATNWGGAFPTSGQSIIDIATGNFPIITATPSWTTPNDIVVGNAGFNGLLDQTAGTVATGNGNWMIVGQGTGGIGTFNLSSTTTTTGNFSGFTVGSGNVNVGGTSTTGGRLVVADGGNSSGTVNMNTSGTLKLEDDGAGIILGNGGTSTGNFNFDGGTVQSNSLASTGIDILLGTNGGKGNFNMSGGTFNGTGGLWLGDNNTGSTGSVQITGGTFNSTSTGAVGSSAQGQVFIGRGTGQGTFTQTGGTVNFTGGTNVGFSNTASTGTAGTLTINGGTFLNTGEMRIGSAQLSNSVNAVASGTFNVSAGTATVTGNLLFARANDNTDIVNGTGTVSGTGTLNDQGDLVLGYAGNADTGKMTVSTGGTLNVGTNNAGKWLMVGQFDTAKGDLEITGGSVGLWNNTAIRFSAGNNVGVNLVNQTGGTVTFYSNQGTTVGGTGVLDLQQGTGTTENNTYNLSGGTLIVPQIVSAQNGGTRTFNFNGGTLQPTASVTGTGTSSFMYLGTGSALANVQAGGALINTNGFNATISQPLIHYATLGATADGGLTKSGSGTLLLGGANTYTGPTNVNAGTLSFSTAASSIGGISVAGSAALGTKLTAAGVNLITAAGSVSLANSSSLTFDFSSLNPTASFINMTAGTLSTGATPGSISVSILNPINLVNGNYKLIDYPAATTIGGGGIAAFSSAPINLGTRATGTIIDSATDTAVELSVSTDVLTWSGANDSSWVTAPTGNNTGAGNWALKSGHTATNFWTTDTVEFNDTYNVGGGNVPPVTSTVNINGGADVNPTKVTFNNTSAVSYTITGANGITGTGSLNKAGTGTVTISSPNSYSGGTNIAAGTLNINGNTALGTGTITVTGGTIDSTTPGIVLSNNNVQSWNGDFTFAGTNSLDMGTGNVTLNGAGSTESVTLTANTLSVGRLIDGGTSPAHSLTLSGNGTLVLTSTANSTVNGTLTVGSGTTLQFNRSTGGNADLVIGGLAGSGTIVNGAATARWLFVTNAVDNTFSGTLANGGTAGLGLNKSGAGALNLTGALSYTDVTTLNAGKLVIGIANTGAGTNTIVNGGTLVLGNTAALGTMTNIQFPATSTGTLDIALNSGSDIPYTVMSNTGAAYTIQSDVATAGPGVTHTLGAVSLGGGSIAVQAGPLATGSTAAMNFGSLVLTSGTAGATSTLNPTTATLSIGTVGNTNGVAHTLILDGTRTDSTITGAITSTSGALGITKTNTGTWTLTGTNTYTGTTIVNGGTLIVNGGSTGLSTVDIQVANAAGTTGTFDVESGTVNSQTFVIAGNSASSAGGAGTVIQNGGIINSAKWFSIGNVGPGTYTLNNGTLNVNSATGTQLEVGTFGTVAGTSTMNVNGGNINLLNNANLTLGAGGTSQNSVVNQTAGTITFYSNAGTTIGGTGALILGSGANPTGNYTYNLNGGTIITPKVTKATTGAAVGVLNLNGGTLKAAGDSTTFISGLSSAVVKLGGALIDDNGHAITIPQALVHDASLASTPDGGLTKSGIGTMTLTGSSTYTGATTISAGTVVLSGTGSINGSAGVAVNGGSKFLQNSTVTVSPTVTLNNGTLDGTQTVNTAIITDSASNILTNGNGGTGALTVNNLTANGAATFNLRITGTTPTVPVVNTTNLTISNSTNAVTININNAALAYNTLNGDGTYDLISYTTGSGVGPSGFTLAPVSGLSNRQTASLAFPSGYVALQITGVNPVWTGGTNSTPNGAWTTADQSPNYNWLLTPPSGPTAGTNFLHGDIVTFDDTATGTTNVDISDVNVDPSTILFNNSTKNYTVSGTKGITDYNSTPTPLVKNGSGSLTISSTNSYSGGTTLNAGTLNINSATAIGNGPLIINGGTFDNTSTGAITLTTNNAQTWGNAAINFGGTNPLNMGTGTVTLSNATTTVTNNGTGALTIGGNITGTGDAIIKAGTGTLVLGGTSTYTGATTVNAGTLSVTGNLSTSPTMNVNNGALLQVSGTVSNTTSNINSGTLDVSGNYTSTGNLWVAQGNGTTGTLTVESTGTVNAGVVLIGAGGSPTNTAMGSGTLASGGIINTTTYFVLAQSGALSTTGAFTDNGGTINVHSSTSAVGNLEVGTFDATAATLNINTGSNINLLNNASINFGAQGNHTGTGTVNQNGGNVTFYSNGGTTVGGTGATNLGTAGTGTYTYNLNGGSLTTPKVARATGTGIMNFNGGTLKAAGDSTTFLQGLTSANVQVGGALIDDGGHTITIGQPLLHATALGATPDGGLSKSGTGVVTLSSTSSYTGGTAINAGTLRLGTGATPANLVAGYSLDDAATTPVQSNSSTQFTIHSSVGGAPLDGTANSNFSSGVTIASGGPSNFNGGHGNALHFDGSGGAVNIINPITDLSGTGNWTVSFWEQTNEAGATFLSKNTNNTWAGGNSIFYLGNGTTTSDDGSGNPVGTYPTAVRNGGGFISTNTNVADNNWHMVTFVGNAGTRSIYLDGVATTLSQTGFTGTDVGNLVQLGFTPDTVPADGAAPLLGNLDDINFYKGALNPTQISALYASNIAGPAAPTTNYLPSTTPVNITASGTTLDMNGSSQRIGSLQGVAGTVVALGGGAVFSGGNNSSTVFAGNITDAGSASTATGGSLVKEGTGTLTLSGSNSYSGDTVVTAGKLVAGSSTALAPSSTVIVGSGTLDTAGYPNTIAALLMGSTGTLNLGLGNVLTSTGMASLAGTLNLSGSIGTLPETLMTYSSEFGTFATQTGITLPPGDQLSYTATALEIISTGGGGAANLVFTGYTGSANSTNWDTTTTDFVPLAGGSPVAYSDTNHDNVTFDTADNISGNYSVSVVSSVSPTSMTVTGGSHYTFSGGNIGSGSTTSLTVASGSSMVFDRGSSSRVTLELGSLTNNGLIDLKNNTMLIHGANGSTASTVQGELQSGFNTGGWNGTSGIISSTAQHSPLYTLGETLVGTDLTVAYTYYGDANLSGTVDGTDYSIIDTNNGLTSGGTWQTGDFNYDGHVDGSDYSLIDNAFNTQTGGNAVTANQIAVSTSEIAGGSAAVPEPATLSLFAIAATAMLGRRRRRNRM